MDAIVTVIKEEKNIMQAVHMGLEWMQCFARYILYMESALLKQPNEV